MIKKLTKSLSRYRDHPEWFAKDILDMQLIWKGQKKIFDKVAKHKRVTVPSGHSTTKSATAAILSLWWLSTRHKSRVVVTAPTFRQLMTVYYAEVNKWYTGSLLDDFKMFTLYASGMTINDESLKKEWFMLPISPKSPDALQGQHGDKSQDVRKIMKEMGITEIEDDETLEEVIKKVKNKDDENSNDSLMVIIDEASGVSREIMEVLEGTDASKLILFGNMTKNNGMFYDSVYRNKGTYEVVQLSSYDSPFMSQEQINYMEELYGKDSNVVRVRLKGLPPSTENDTIIPRELLEKYVDAIIKPENLLDDTNIDIGADVARYGDDNGKIYCRRGSYTVFEKTFSKKNTMRMVGEISKIAIDNPNIKINAKVDPIGVGTGVCDRLDEIDHNNVEIIEIVNNATAENEEEYANLITELFFEFLKKLKAGMVSIPVDSDILIEDLSARKYGFDSKGRLLIESKDEFKKRVGRSPDDGDAFLMCWADNNSSKESFLIY